MAEPIVLSATTMIGDTVKNLKGDEIGKIEEIMIDIDSGLVAYAVLSFGGFMGFGDKLFAIPWGMLEIDTENKNFILDIDADRLEDAPGFDKDNWPQMITREWINNLYVFYKQETVQEKQSA